MFCSNCGKEINENQKFCRYCGAKNEDENQANSLDNEILNNTQSQQINTVFNRSVLTHYLSNIRTLELYRNKLHKSISSLEYQISNLGIRKVSDGGIGGADLEDAIPVFGFVVLVIVVTLIGGSILKGTLGKLFGWEDFFSGLMNFIIAVMIIVAIGTVIYLIVENAKANNEYEIRLSNDKRRVNEELIEKKALSKQLSEFESESDKIEALLNDAYSINIIPSKFRNMYAAYFLYDYISTSTATLNEALLHCDLDTIQQKLNEIIDQQQEIIMELAYQNALNEKLVKQNEQILGHAIQAENNTALAAQYTKIAANNTGVVAAIQMSEYLKP